MKRKRVTFVSQGELIKMIKDEFDVDIESIVANEEIGNQDYVINVMPNYLSDEQDLQDAIKNPMFKTDTFVDFLYIRSKIIDETVVVDCKW